MGCPVCGDFGPLWKAEVDLMGACPCGYVPRKRAAKESAPPVETSDLATLPLHGIADRIRRDWGGKMYFGAVPYVDAMSSLSSIADPYGLDSGKSIVLYFLANANTWRGPVARAIKAELKARAAKSR